MLKSILTIISIITITSTAHASFFEERAEAVQSEINFSGTRASDTYYQRLAHTHEEIEDNIMRARRACMPSMQAVDRRTGQALPNSGYSFTYQQQCLDQAGASVGMKLDPSGGGSIFNGGIKEGVIQNYRLISYYFVNEKGQKIYVNRSGRDAFLLNMGAEASSSGFASFILHKGGRGTVNDLRIPIVSTGRNMAMIQQTLNINTLPKLAEQFYNDIVSKRGMAFHYYVGELLVNPEIRNEFMEYIASLSAKNETKSEKSEMKPAPAKTKKFGKK